MIKVIYFYNKIKYMYLQPTSSTHAKIYDQDFYLRIHFNIHL